MKIKKLPSKRPFKTDYGTTQGHCASGEGAMKSVAKYLVDNGRRRATIEAPDDKGVMHTVARVYHNSFWGLMIVPVRQSSSSARVYQFKKRAA